MAFMSVPALDYFKNKPKACLVLPVAALILGMLASILSGTRGAWIAIPALSVILFYYLLQAIGFIPRVICLVIVIGALMAAYFIPGAHLANRVNAFFKDIGNYCAGDLSYSSVGTRIEGWQVAWNIFRDHPVIGAGPGNYKPLMDRMIADGKQYNSAARHKQPHGAFPSTLADTGLLGLLSLIGVFFTPLWAALRFIRHRNPLRSLGYAMMILVVGFIHFGLTETIFSRNINLVFYIVLSSVIMAVAANELEERPTERSNSKALHPPKST
jgi:O-antigen ligase